MKLNWAVLMNFKLCYLEKLCCFLMGNKIVSAVYSCIESIGKQFKLKRSYKNQLQCVFLLKSVWISVNLMNFWMLNKSYLIQLLMELPDSFCILSHPSHTTIYAIIISSDKQLFTPIHFISLNSLQQSNFETAITRA